jgi:hypothetical protein
VFIEQPIFFTKRFSFFVSHRQLYPKSESA